MASKTKVEGGRDLDKALMELSKAAGKAAVRRALMKAGEPIAEAGAAAAPVGPTGNLNKSYGVGTKLTQRQAKMARRETKNHVEVHVGPNDPAAIQTEFGNEHQAAEPHLRPAWDGNKHQALEIVKIELGKEIDKSVARAAKRAARLAAKG
ncbi:HK97-gp10 family putative phage morphogenesis protein [Martelella soudanensis]|uniref:HK97-gp10 family putative phage morphogenesis protein n=1 Tax=unclassified Martelella TaxID=2629616 RepID=UPI0015E046E5|nr:MULTISPECIES: HK97-gp10 family putative phage morphogenesis protein [unclassified Martelella]